MLRTCDVFCTVVDNYGDIGVCWRLARQLANEQGLAVRLWVDDLSSFAKLYPGGDAGLARQRCEAVEVCRWAGDFPGVLPADIVIGAFACVLPEAYVAAMSRRELPSVWINLEYLSAEEWVEGCHGLPSPHPTLPLTKYFFFPGFTEKTGGLLLERDYFVRRDAFLCDAVQQDAFWRDVGMAPPAAATLKVSLFAYENAALPELFDVWARGEREVLCLVPEGRILPQVRQYFQADERSYALGKLVVRVLPFVPQQDYDRLLWACDVNFVRGEDSCIRAQWAGKPFVWQIYPQHDAIHWEKLQALLALYGAGMSEGTQAALRVFWQAWNAECGVAAAWPHFSLALGELAAYAPGWAASLGKNNLALNLLAFCLEMGRMRAFKIEGQSS